MKRKLLIILSIIILIIGGYFILNEYKKKRLVNEAQEKAEEYLMENYEDVESVQVTPDNYRFDPINEKWNQLLKHQIFHLIKMKKKKMTRFNLCLFFENAFLINKFLLQKLQNSEPGVPFYEKETVNHFFNHCSNNRLLFRI